MVLFPSPLALWKHLRNNNNNKEQLLLNLKIYWTKRYNLGDLTHEFWMTRDGITINSGQIVCITKPEEVFRERKN